MILVRPGKPSDIPALTEIYNHYVLHTDAVFDEEPATRAARTAWFEHYASTGPHRIFVAEEDGAVLGWASSQLFRPHAAFRKDVETSIMLDPKERGKGLGRLLYGELINVLAHEDVHRIYAGVALPNPSSVAIHLRFGFTQIALYDEYAVKHGRFISSAWFERKM